MARRETQPASTRPMGERGAGHNRQLVEEIVTQERLRQMGFDGVTSKMTSVIWWVARHRSTTPRAICQQIMAGEMMLMRGSDRMRVVTTRGLGADEGEEGARCVTPILTAA